MEQQLSHCGHTSESMSAGEVHSQSTEPDRSVGARRSSANLPVRPLPGGLGMRIDSPINDLRADVEFVEMPVKQIINRCDNPRMPFNWTINPYRGCEFGCLYCYARYTHEFLDLKDPLDFERRIFVKRMAAGALTRALSRLPIGNESIALGTATDPYQPAERKYELTRSMLKVFARLGGVNLSITTKSALIARDADLLSAIARRSRLSVNFSIITLNRRLQRILEPRAPRPELRLHALSTLRAAGVRCNVMVMPVIPGITDEPPAIESVVAAARRAGANQVWWRPLFLKPAAARRFLPFVAQAFPHLALRMQDYYGARAYPPREYEEHLRGVFERLHIKYGFSVERRGKEAARPPTQASRELQLKLRQQPL